MPHYVITRVLEPVAIHQIDLAKIPGAELDKPRFGTLKFTVAEVFVEAATLKKARVKADQLIDDRLRQETK